MEIVIPEFNHSSVKLLCLAPNGVLNYIIAMLLNSVYAKLGLYGNGKMDGRDISTEFHIDS